PNSVQRCRCDGHSSRPAIAGRLKRPTRKFGAPSRHALGCYHPGSFPIWSCSVWGLPCPAHYCAGGALLPHLFTLIPPSGTVCFLWHFPSNVLEHALPDVIRHTALRSSDFPPSFRAASPRRAFAAKRRPSGPASAISIIGWLAQKGRFQEKSMGRCGGYR